MPSYHLSLWHAIFLDAQVPVILVGDDGDFATALAPAFRSTQKGLGSHVIWDGALCSSVIKPIIPA
jgi:hypothetical protein